MEVLYQKDTWHMTKQNMSVSKQIIKLIQEETIYKSVDEV